MKNKRRTRIVALLMAVLLVIGLANPYGMKGSTTAFAATLTQTSNTQKTNVTDNVSRQNVDFKTMEYQHYDYKEFEQKLEEIRSLMKSEKYSSQVLEKFELLGNEISKVNYASELVALYNSLDVTDPYYETEYIYCYQTIIQMRDDLVVLGKDILSSPCGKAARDAWGEDANYLEETEVTSKEESKLLNEEQSLLMKYNSAVKKEYTTTIKGKKYTLEDLYETSNLTYRQYVSGYKSIMKKKNKALGNIYVKLVKVRQKLAKYYGYNSYADYRYEVAYSRDYSVKQVSKVYKDIKKYIVPVFLELAQSTDENAISHLDARFEKMSTKKQCELMKPYLSQISPSLFKAFEYMEKNNLYDIAYSDTKKDEAFTTILTQYLEPYLYSQQGFNFYDMMTLIHEFGHFHGFYVNYLDGNDYSNLDLAEIHSQALELLYTKFYKKMLGKKDGAAAIQYTLLQRVDSIIEGALYDEFQQKVYALKKPTLNKINRIYTKLCKEYGLVDEDSTTISYGWMDVSHNFSSPFYYISYCMSVIPAFELWEESIVDWKDACEKYMDIVEHGERSPYLETLEECDLSNPFSRGYFKKLANTIRKYAN